MPSIVQSHFCRIYKVVWWFYFLIFSQILRFRAHNVADVSARMRLWWSSSKFSRRSSGFFVDPEKFIRIKILLTIKKIWDCVDAWFEGVLIYTNSYVFSINWRKSLLSYTLSCLPSKYRQRIGIRQKFLDEIAIN